MRTKRSVSRVSQSFPHFSRALYTSAFRLCVDESFDADVSAFVIEAEPLGRPIDFQLKTEVDLKSLADQAGVPADSVSLSIVLESPELKRNRVLVSWKHDQVPRVWDGVVPEEGFGQRRVGVALVCHLNRTLERSLDKPWRNGSILSRRIFTISLPGHSSWFKVSWESFTALGLEPEALWNVDFKITDCFHEVEPEAAVLVQLNKDLPGFHRLFDSAAARNPKLSVPSGMVLKTVAAGIVGDLTIRVLSDLRDQEGEYDVVLDDVREDSFTGKVLELLKQMSLDPEESMEWAVREPHRLRQHIQGVLRVGSTFDQRALDRLLSV